MRGLKFRTKYARDPGPRPRWPLPKAGPARLVPVLRSVQNETGTERRPVFVRDGPDTLLPSLRSGRTGTRRDGAVRTATRSPGTGLVPNGLRSTYTIRLVSIRVISSTDVSFDCRLNVVRDSSGTLFPPPKTKPIRTPSDPPDRRRSDPATAVFGRDDERATYSYAHGRRSRLAVVDGPVTTTTAKNSNERHYRTRG